LRANPRSANGAGGLNLFRAEIFSQRALPLGERGLCMRCVYICYVLLWGMIAGFRDADTERLWTAGRCKRLPARLNRQALKKLYILNAALAMENLTVPQGNRLEKLRGDRDGQLSIRINDRYRICFVWRDGNAHEVEVVDYR